MRVRQQADALWQMLNLASVAESVRAVEAGLPWYVIPRLAEALGVPVSSLLGDLGMSPSTWRRRVAGSDRLTSIESDRVLRLLRLLHTATDLFEGDHAATQRWLSLPLRAIGGRTPLAYARTEVGAGEVLDVVGRLEQGIVT